MKRILAVMICFGLFITALAAAPLAAAAATGKTSVSGWDQASAEQYAAEHGMLPQSALLPTGDKVKDWKACKEKLDTCGQITFLPGCTYLLHSYLNPPSGTKIYADQATIKLKSYKTGIMNDLDDRKGAYTDGIEIFGGDWQMYYIKKPDGWSTAFRFIHAKNISMKNMKVVSNYSCHIVELIACQNVLIDNCTLEMAPNSLYPDAKNEAIQLDFASNEKNARPVYRDLKPCENVTITNNALKFYRGVATNVRSGEGGREYKIKYKNIVISGNTITSTRGCGLYMTNVENLTMENNTLKGSYSTAAITTRNLTGTLIGPKSMSRLTVKALKSGAAKVTGTKHKSASVTVTIGGVPNIYTKPGTTYSVKVPKLLKGTSVKVEQIMPGYGNKFTVTTTVK
jgi:parallel beta-helix repeat protein